MDLHESSGKGRKSRPSRRKRLKAYCGCPCHAVSTVFRGIGRCMFVCCYPVVQCSGLDEHRHRHHHQKRFNW